MNRGITSVHHHRRLSLIYFLSLITLTVLAADTDQQLPHQQVPEDTVSFVTNSTVNGSLATTDRDRSFAGMIDRALEKEFTESDQTEGFFIIRSTNHFISFQLGFYLFNYLLHLIVRSAIIIARVFNLFWNLCCQIYVYRSLN